MIYIVSLLHIIYVHVYNNTVVVSAYDMSSYVAYYVTVLFVYTCMCMIFIHYIYIHTELVHIHRLLV